MIMGFVCKFDDGGGGVLGGGRRGGYMGVEDINVGESQGYG